eukprot:3529225-Amphidinium_carterae.1
MCPEGVLTTTSTLVNSHSNMDVQGTASLNFTMREGNRRRQGSTPKQLSTEVSMWLYAHMQHEVPSTASCCKVNPSSLIFESLLPSYSRMRLCLVMHGSCNFEAAFVHVNVSDVVKLESFECVQYNPKLKLTIAL